MYDITLNSMIYAHKNLMEKRCISEHGIRIYVNDDYQKRRYCTAHRAITKEEYNTCKDCMWKMYCHSAAGKVLV